MEEPRYENLLFGDISAMTQLNRIGPDLDTVLERDDWHARLVNGIDPASPRCDAFYEALARLGLPLLTSLLDLLLLRRSPSIGLSDSCDPICFILGLSDLSLRLFEIGCGLIHGRFECAGVDGEQDVALFDELVVLYG